MAFRVHIIPPIRVTPKDHQRRQRRYREQASSTTVVTVGELADGPEMLYTSDDIAVCDQALSKAGSQIGPEQADAILIDCIFDPAVTAITQATGVPTFGPLRTSLPLMAQIAPRFALIAAIESHCEPLINIVSRYGYGDQLIAVRSLGEVYPVRDQFEPIMRQQLETVIEEGAEAVMMGSTTMAITDPMRTVAGRIPLFCSGMLTLGVMETLWKQNLLSANQ